MDTKLFTKNDSGFTCEYCGKEVKPLGYSSRNHCPYCLWSKHLDINPGDRESSCGGLMEPLYALPDGDCFIIVHKCTKCGEIHRNRSAFKSKNQNDNINLLISLTVNKDTF